jgi:hypothetical protein
MKSQVHFEFHTSARFRESVPLQDYIVSLASEEVNGNETTEGLARNGSASEFVRQDPALAVSRQVLRKKISR